MLCATALTAESGNIEIRNALLGGGGGGGGGELSKQGLVVRQVFD